MHEAESFEVRVDRRVDDASGAARFALRPTTGTLPPFEAGAHVDIFLPNGLIRSYSLMNAEDEANLYVCGIGRDAKSRGGSAYMHDQVHEGAILTITPPKNLFPLDTTSGPAILLAGGIGVTPMISMARRLNAIGRPWRLYFCARSRTVAPFLSEVSGLGPNLHPHFDDEMDGAFLDIPAIIAAAEPDAHFYCCGPAPMISAFEAATIGVATERVHLERFASDQAAATDGGFTVVLTRSGLTLRVASGQTILEAIEAAGVEVPFSCLVGICGSCVTTVLEGVPDHRDMILTDKERSGNDQMMICCSGSLSDRLVLDR